MIETIDSLALHAFNNSFLLHFYSYLVTQNISYNRITPPINRNFSSKAKSKIQSISFPTIVLSWRRLSNDVNYRVAALWIAIGIYVNCRYDWCFCRGRLAGTKLSNGSVLTLLDLWELVLCILTDIEHARKFSYRDIKVWILNSKLRKISYTYLLLETIKGSI